MDRGHVNIFLNNCVVNELISNVLCYSFSYKVIYILKYNIGRDSETIDSMFILRFSFVFNEHFKEVKYPTVL